MKVIPIISYTRHFTELRDFFAWCRAQHIPILSCKVDARHFETIPYQMRGSRFMHLLYEEISERSPRAGMDIRTAHLIREEDFALVAIHHGRIKLGWRDFVKESIYGKA